MIKKINNFLANKLSVILSSMWLFWILAVILVVAGILQPPKGAYEVVMFWVSAAFQAVALPVLAFVSNIQGDRQEKIMRETHDAVMKEIKLLREEQAELKKLQEQTKSKN
jgi:cell shape-determining protein MreC